MKIVSQLSNAAPDAGKSAPVDTSKSNFQTTFADARACAVVAAGKVPESKPQKTQVTETKKSSNSESKKSNSPSMAEGPIPVQLPSIGSQSTPIVSPVLPVPAPSEDASGGSGATADQFSGELAPSDMVAMSGANAAQAAGILAQPSAPVPGAVVAPESPSAKSVSTHGSDVPGTLAKLVPMPIAASETAPTPAIKALDTAAGQHSGADGTASQSKAAASAQSDAVSGRSAADALPPSTLPSPVALPQSVAQQAFAQDAGATVAVSNTWNLKVPPAKSDAPAGASPVTASGKSKPTSTRADGAADDKQTATGTDSEPMKAQIGAAEVISKDDASNGSVGFAQGTALAQSTHAAQLAGPTPSVDAQGAATPSTNSAASPGATAQPGSAENAQAAHAMSSAQLIQSVHGSEMRLGMQSAEFGSISINTALSHQALSAQISIDHSALGHALAAHLPAIEEKLGSAYGVQARVELRDTGTNASPNDSSGRESKGNGQSQTSDNGPSAAFLESPIDALTSSTYTSVAASSSRLDIRI